MLPKVKAAFEAIWGSEELLVSFDGFNIFLPYLLNPEWLTKGGWYHVDQNAIGKGQKKGRHCVQGFVTLTEATEHTGGLVVIPGSHLQHTEMCERIEIAQAVGDYVPIPEGDPLLEQQPVLVCAQPGDLILWDSRTVHCNTPALTLGDESPSCPKYGYARGVTVA